MSHVDSRFQEDVVHHSEKGIGAGAGVFSPEAEQTGSKSWLQNYKAHPK